MNSEWPVNEQVSLSLSRQSHHCQRTRRFVCNSTRRFVLQAPFVPLTFPVLVAFVRLAVEVVFKIEEVKNLKMLGLDWLTSQ